MEKLVSGKKEIILGSPEPCYDKISNQKSLDKKFWIKKIFLFLFNDLTIFLVYTAGSQ
jgi:hypothetical protein